MLMAISGKQLWASRILWQRHRLKRKTVCLLKMPAKTKVSPSIGVSQA
jgi:hypothetical protein